MIKLISKMRGFSQDQSGATAIEYGLIAGLVAVVIIGALTLLGGGLTTTFTAITTALGG
jgi:pilus assembly protein Flp/PilA